MGQATDAKMAEIDRNLQAFLAMLPDLLKEHAGEHALMHSGQVVAYFPSALDAQIAGNQRFEATEFSIQQVTEQAEELGFYSYALHSRQS